MNGQQSSNLHHRGPQAPQSQHFSNLPPPIHQLGPLLSPPSNQHSSLASPSSSSSTPSSPSPHPHHVALQQSYLDFATTHPHHIQQQQQHQSSLSYLTHSQQSSHHSKPNSDLIVQQDLFIQMQQQYEQQIRSLQMEIQTMKQAMLSCNNNNSTGNSSKKSSKNNSHNQQPPSHIVETYCEEIGSKEFCCKNCSYKTKSEASLIIHNTNHLVSQRYLHLPTTVFSTVPKTNEQGSGFLYPCGECTGKFHHNDLYLHIYQHHTGENPFHCDECNLFFMHYEFLDDHQRTHHMKSINIYQKVKKARYDSNTICSQLVYYSVVKCSKPFTSFVPNTNANRTSSWNHHETISANNQPAFPYATKRGRGRGSSHGMSRISSILPPSFQNLIQTNNNNNNNNNNNTLPTTNNTNPTTPTNELQSTNNDEPFKCHYEDCFFSADTNERLDFHLFAHRNSRFKCPYCPYVSNVLNDIKRHCLKGQKHDGPMFNCPNCENMQTNCDKTFKDHIKTVHFGKMIDDKTLQAYVEDLFRNNTNITT